VTVLALAALALTACGDGSEGDVVGAEPMAPHSAGAASVVPGGDPVDLVGSWHIEGAQGEEPGAVLRVADDVMLWRECGAYFGSWRAASGGLFVASFDGAEGGCPMGEEPTPGWLARTVGFAVDGDERSLLAADGSVTARLRPGARPTASSHMLPELAEPPEVTPELREALAPAEPLSEELTPAAAPDLVGRWIPAEGDYRSAPEQPHVQLDGDGTWSGSDGCNGSGGRWTAGQDGALIATSGASTLIGCDGAPVDSWLYSAADAGFDGDDVLVLVGPDGTETGRLRRVE
jgi:hypothetical protein